GAPRDIRWKAAAISTATLHRALADVAVRYRCLPARRRHAVPVEQHGILIRDAELAVVAAPLVDRSNDVPLVVGATAESRRRLERVVIAKRRLRQTLLRRFLEARIRPGALVEELIELRHIAVAVEAEIAREVLRSDE